MNALLRLSAVVLFWSFCGIHMEPDDFSVSTSKELTPFVIPRDFTQENVSYRLDIVEGAIDLEYSEAANELIKRYMLGGRNDTQKLIERSFYYFPLFDHYFDKYDVPKELKYITLLESALKPSRSSAVGARGLWQFMPATARWMGLSVDHLEDERTNPAISTEAAVRYLGQLYAQFDDWNLVLLAYNAGPGAVRNAIRQSNSREIKDVLPYLPKQTRKYLPFYTATVYALNYYMEYGIIPQPTKPSLINVEATRTTDRV